MVLTKEYRICMPITVEEYRIGQLYMIARHSYEQSTNGEGVEVVVNENIVDENYGTGQFTEKRIYLSSHLPSWILYLAPKMFYITEKAWNFYPYTKTEYTCSFIPKFSINIETKYEDNNGTTENCLGLSEEELQRREVDYIDIAYDEVKEKHYKDSEDLKLFKSVKCERGPLGEGWRDSVKPIMCCYKVVHVNFEVWGLQTRVEDFAHHEIRHVLLLGHRQAFAWIDDWLNMSIEDVRNYEKEMQLDTNAKVMSGIALSENSNEKSTQEDDDPCEKSNGTPKHDSGEEQPKTPSQESKGWFSW